jgi:hypothetical protein
LANKINCPQPWQGSIGDNNYLGLTIHSNLSYPKTGGNTSLDETILGKSKQAEAEILGSYS